MPAEDFLETYFISPIINRSGYNIVNTTVYSILFVIFVSVIYWLIKRLDIDIKGFLIHFSPFIVIGGVVRALTDHNIYLHPFFSRIPGYLLVVTPGIYLSVFMLSLFAIIIARFIEKATGISWAKIGCSLGLIILIYILTYVRIVEYYAFFLIIFLALASTIVLSFILYEVGFPYFYKNRNYIVLFGHMLDSSATFIGVDLFGFSEQHVLPRFFFELTGTAAVLYILKLLVLIPAIYYIEKYLDNEDYKIFIKLVIFVLGFGPGTRDLFTLGMYGS